MNVTFSAKVWQYDAPGGWYFVTLPPELAANLRSLQPPGLKGFGSVGVTVTCGPVTWSTSLFPDKKRGSYLLPLKASIRQRLGVAAGQVIQLTLEVS